MVIKYILILSYLFPICFKIRGSSRNQSTRITSLSIISFNSLIFFSLHLFLLNWWAHTLKISIAVFVFFSFSLFTIHSAVYSFVLPKSHFPKYSRSSFIDIFGNFTSLIMRPCFGIISINFSVFSFDSRHLATGVFSFSVINPCLRTVKTEISFLLFISSIIALSSSFVILFIMFCFLNSSITILNAQSSKSLSCCKKSEIPIDLTVV